MDTKTLNNRLKHCLLSDVHRFRRRLHKLKNQKVKNSSLREDIEKLAAEIEQSAARVEARRAGVPAVSYPEGLPIADKHAEICDTIKNNQVTILCGETGSGKTTQLPKICLDAGLGIRGKIAHTQPRRLAARAVSSRIAEELNCELGSAVGYKVRFTDQSSADSYIKLMTDGILLAECNNDPWLNEYDTIIIDEAHERSLNIDFLLGYLKQLVNKRKDLKLIITSATIDPESFAKHFNDAPVINVSGRTYPVEVHYRPWQDEDDERSMDEAIIDAVDELSDIGRGDILVFLSGERDIREAQQAMEKAITHSGKRHWGNTEVLPLLARQTNAEQNRIFHPSGKRRIVLATNVAETSLTVPGIRYVIDSGIARISRYSWRSKIQRLPIEKISQASANQRKGRCGRVAEGVCIRLYDEDDFEQRPLFTEPEIQRTNLAAVILQMENQRLGHIDNFPFLQPPESRLINDGYHLLFELGAIDSNNNLTRTGKQLARLPIDPRLARMLSQAEKEAALTEVLIIVSALAVQDPRDRPMDKQQAADQAHAEFSDKSSDFVFFINLWNAYFEQKQQLSNNQLRKWCKQHYLSWMRMREWIDTHRQIRQMLKELKMTFNKNASDYDSIHRSLLSGLLGNIGHKHEQREFLGARNRKFHVFPGSKLHRSPPQWVMASEIVETSKVYARTLAKIEPQWLEDIGKHLLKYSYAEPHWEKKRAQVVAHEKSTLYGVVVNPDKRVHYGRIKSDESRAIFIREALIEGDFDCKLAFYHHNRQVLNKLESLEAKSRRRDIIDEEMLYDHYDELLPQDVVSGSTLDKWARRNPDAADKLKLDEQELIHEDATVVDNREYPDTLELNGSLFPIEYHFDPNKQCDGITLVTPLAAVDVINPQRCEWLIPGMLHDKMTELIRSLPKQLRKNFVPAPNYADACIESIEPSDAGLCTAMAAHLKKMTGVQIPYDAWNLETIPQHLLMNFRVIAPDNSVLAEGRNLQSIKDQLRGGESGSSDDKEDYEYEYEDQQQIDAPTIESSTIEPECNQDGVGPAIIGTLDKTTEIDMQGVLIKAYPALVVEGKQVNVRALESEQAAQRSTQLAMRQLVKQRLRVQLKDLRHNIPNIQQLCLKYSELGRCEELKDDIIDTTIDEIFLVDPIDNEQQFEQRIEQGKDKLYEKVENRSKLLSDIFDEYRTIRKLIKNPNLNQLDTTTDIQHQLSHLFCKHFITVIPTQWLEQYPRYLKAIQLRYDKSSHNAARDRQYRIEISDLWQQYEKRQQAAEQAHIESEQLQQYRWMLEEYRISLFAQEVKTRIPVSAKRLKQAWNAIDEV